jgi:tagatose 6-phosphate kinase
VILTFTPNPAWDVTYEVDRLVAGTTHRVHTVYARAGGKGINVSRILAKRGIPTMAVFPVGRAVGRLLTDDLSAAAIDHDPVEIGGATRMTVTIVERSQADRPPLEAGRCSPLRDDVTNVFAEPGPALTTDEWSALIDRVDRHLARTSVLVCSGSFPPDVDKSGQTRSAPARLVEMSKASGHLVLLDTSGPGLLAAAEAGASVLKPNAQELREVVGLDDLCSGAQALCSAGAGAVVVSAGEDGLIAVTAAGEAWCARPPFRVDGNPTGAGDAVVAALAYGLSTGASWPEQLTLAVAWSAAAVAAPVAGEVDPDVLATVAGQVSIVPI